MKLSKTFLQTFARTLSESFYDRFKVPATNAIPAEEVHERYSRELALKLACNSGNVQCLADTFAQVKSLADDNIKAPKGLENVIYCSGFRGFDKNAEWIAIYQKMQETSDSVFKMQMIFALGCTDDLELLAAFLDSAIGDDNSVNYSDSERRAVVNSVLSSHSGFEAMVHFINDFELDIQMRLGFGSTEEVLNIPAQSIKTEDQKLLFIELLANKTFLQSDELGRITSLFENNLSLQRQSPNFEIIEMIHKVVTPEVTTTIPEVTTTSSSPGSSTTTQSSSSTSTSQSTTTRTNPTTSSVSSTATPTSSTTSQTTTTSSASSTQTSTTQLLSTTEGSTQVSSSEVPTVALTTETTTPAGAAALSVKLLILIPISLCLMYSVNYF